MIVVKKTPRVDSGLKPATIIKRIAANEFNTEIFFNLETHV